MVYNNNTTFKNKNSISHVSLQDVHLSFMLEEANVNSFLYTLPEILYIYTHIWRYGETETEIERQRDRKKVNLHYD